AIPVLFVSATASNVPRGVVRLHGGWPLSIACVFVLVLVQQMDTRLLSRRLVKREVRLHPVTVLLSLLVGGTLLGLWGMLLAVPAATGPAPPPEAESSRAESPRRERRRATLP